MIVNPILYQQGTKLPELTNPGAAADLLAGKQLVDQYSNPLTGTMPEVTQATPSISVSSSGLITASAAQDAGHVAAGTKSNTKQLTTQSGKTVTPGTSRQTAVASGRYTTGAVYVAGDANLKAENIRNGVSLFGVTGTYNGQTIKRKILPSVPVSLINSKTLRFNFNALPDNPTEILIALTSIPKLKYGSLSYLYPNISFSTVSFGYVQYIGSYFGSIAEPSVNGSEWMISSSAFTSVSYDGKFCTLTNRLDFADECSADTGTCYIAYI